MSIEGILNYPAFLKIRTVGGTERYLNSNMVVEFAPSKEKDLEKATDIVMLNGQVHTVNETPSQLIENRYKRDVKCGSSVINLLG